MTNFEAFARTASASAAASLASERLSSRDQLLRRMLALGDVIAAGAIVLVLEVSAGDSRRFSSSSPLRPLRSSSRSWSASTIEINGHCATRRSTNCRASSVVSRADGVRGHAFPHSFESLARRSNRPHCPRTIGWARPSSVAQQCRLIWRPIRLLSVRSSSTVSSLRRRAPQAQALRGHARRAGRAPCRSHAGRAS